MTTTNAPDALCDNCSLTMPCEDAETCPHCGMTLCGDCLPPDFHGCDPKEAGK